MQANTSLPPGCTSTTREGGNHMGRWQGNTATRMRGARRPRSPLTAVGKKPSFLISTGHTLMARPGALPPAQRNPSAPQALRSGSWVRPTWPAPAAPGSWKPSPGPAQPWLLLWNRPRAAEAGTARQRPAEPKPLLLSRGRCAGPRCGWCLTASSPHERAVTAAMCLVSSGLLSSPRCRGRALLRRTVHTPVATQQLPNTPRRAAPPRGCRER